MTIRCDICVIGGGAVGKAGALALARAGLNVVLVSPESLTTPADALGDWDLRVFALNHVAHALLSSLKVWEAMDSDRIAPVDAMAIHGDGEASGGHLGFDAYGARVDALAWIVEDQNLNRALDNALRFASGLTCLQGAAVAMYIEGERVQVSLDNGRRIDCSLVVGADGANSWVRAQADIDMDYRSYGQRGVVANFECDHPHHGVARQWFLGEAGIVALLPLPGRRVSLVWSAPDSLAAQLLREPPQQLCERLRDLPGQTLGHFSLLPPCAPQAFPLRLIRTHSVVAPRIALIGDAAHVVHPLAGHGMNLGFGDIDGLLTALNRREHASDCGDARTLARYARSRKEEVLLMQVATDGLQRLFASEFAPVRLIRNIGMSAVDKLPFLKRQLMAHAFGRSSIQSGLGEKS